MVLVKDEVIEGKISMPIKTTKITSHDHALVFLVFVHEF